MEKTLSLTLSSSCSSSHPLQSQPIGIFDLPEEILFQIFILVPEWEWGTLVQCCRKFAENLPYLMRSKRGVIFEREFLIDGQKRKRLEDREKYVLHTRFLDKKTPIDWLFYLTAYKEFWDAKRRILLGATNIDIKYTIRYHTSHFWHLSPSKQNLDRILHIISNLEDLHMTKRRRVLKDPRQRGLITSKELSSFFIDELNSIH